MTTRIEPENEGYARIYEFWIANGRPGVCQIGGEKYFRLETDGKIVFIKLNDTDDDYYHSMSFVGNSR